MAGEVGCGHTSFCLLLPQAGLISCPAPHRPLRKPPRPPLPPHCHPPPCPSQSALLQRLQSSPGTGGWSCLELVLGAGGLWPQGPITCASPTGGVRSLRARKAGEPPLSPCPHLPASKAASFGIELQATQTLQACLASGTFRPPFTSSPDTGTVPSSQACGLLATWPPARAADTPQATAGPSSSSQALEAPRPGLPGDHELHAAVGSREDAEAGPPPAGPRRSPPWRTCRR